MKTQTRGNCQCCGRDQAVTRGSMAHHGYEVKDGYFRGVCQGHKYQPMQTERAVADQIIESCRADAIRLDRLAADYKAGKIVPTEAKSGEWKLERQASGAMRRVDIMVPFDEAPDYEQRDATKTAIGGCQSRAASARSFANGLERIANECHGQPLREVAQAEAAARIEKGEKRQALGGAVLIADYQDGAMVRYHYFRASVEKPFHSKMASRSWRALPSAS